MALKLPRQLLKYPYIDIRSFRRTPDYVFFLPAAFKWPYYGFFLTPLCTNRLSNIQTWIPKVMRRRRSMRRRRRRIGSFLTVLGFGRWFCWFKLFVNIFCIETVSHVCRGAGVSWDSVAGFADFSSSRTFLCLQRRLAEVRCLFENYCNSRQVRSERVAIRNDVCYFWFISNCVGIRSPVLLI